jgi:argininosuccinate lyase
MKKSNTLWSPDASTDHQMLAYTIGDDRVTDVRLLRWDILGSFGQVQALLGGGIINARQAAAMRKALRAALLAAEQGSLRIGDDHEDVHSAVELWLTERFGEVGEQIHTGRSRNDQVALDIRLWAKDATLAIHAGMLDLSSQLLAFAKIHQKVLWPGFTHHRAAMPSSAGAWAAGYAEQLIDAADAIAGIWPRLDRSPLGSAAGYGAPLPLDRQAAALTLGFSGVDQAVTTVQGSRGQLEAAILFWCCEAAHPMARLSTDVILYTAEDTGWLTLPIGMSTGSSIMPQKRNPDLFELTRGRAAALTGDLNALMAIKAGLSGGYHRDFQLLKAPLFRGVDRTREMLTMLAAAVPQLGVDSERGSAWLRGGLLATDEVMNRVRQGKSFRSAYREVAGEIKRGAAMPQLTEAEIIKARTSIGGLGNLGLGKLVSRGNRGRRWNDTERRRFEAAMTRVAAGGR